MLLVWLLTPKIGLEWWSNGWLLWRVYGLCVSLLSNQTDAAKSLTEWVLWIWKKQRSVLTWNARNFKENNGRRIISTVI